MADARPLGTVAMSQRPVTSGFGDDEDATVAKGLAVRTHAPGQRLGMETHRHRGDKKKRRSAAQHLFPRIFAWHFLRRNLPQARSLR